MIRPNPAVRFAVLVVDAPADREALISAGDFVNRAMFTPEELDGGRCDPTGRG